MPTRVQLVPPCPTRSKPVTFCHELKRQALNGKPRETNCANNKGRWQITPTLGVTPVEHSQLKKLDKVKTGNNLRDHMTDLELIFTMLGEASTTEIARRSDAQGFVENKTSAKQGGRIAGDARKALEAKTGKPVLSKGNYLPAPKSLNG